jgi:peroxiredoxin
MQGILLTVVVVLEAVILVTLWLLLYQLVKQQGRMLLRLDKLEQHIAHGGMIEGAQAQPRGLTVGTSIPPFSLPDLSGKIVSLEELRGKKVLLINWSPECGFCEVISSDLARLQDGFRKRNVQLLLVSHADAESNRKLVEEHGLGCPVLLQKESQDLEMFENQGTPVAYLLDEQGRVAQPFAYGADEVVALAKAVAAGRLKKRKHLRGERPLTESRIERDGLKAGIRAPSFSLPDIHGRTVSLDEYRGRRVFLVFSDPQCGPCDQLAPQLVELHQQHRDNGLAVVMVGRGDPEENRRKAEEQSFEFPVVLQRKWELSKEYGIFETPVAFLIGEDGVIARNVASGVDEIMALARKGLDARKEKVNGQTF